MIELASQSTKQGPEINVASTIRGGPAHHDRADGANGTSSLLRRLVSRKSDLSTLMEESGALAAKSLGLDGYSLAERAAPNQLRVRYWRLVDGTPKQVGESHLYDNPSDSAAGFAMHAGCVVTFSDLSEQRDFNDPFLSRYGVARGIVAPLIHNDHTYGAMGVFGREPGELIEKDVLLIEPLAHLLAAASAGQRAQIELAAQTQFIAATIDAMDSMLLVLTPDGTITQVNQACAKISGFKFREVQHRSIWSAFLVPEEADLMHDAFQRLKKGESPTKLETFLLTKHGQRMRIAWSLTTQRDHDEKLRAIIASGIDVTHQFAALEKIKQLEANYPDEETQGTGLPEELVETVAIGESENEDLPPGIPFERRRHRRRPCPYIQRLAPIVDGTLPNLSEFYDVRCRNISSRGFAFLLPALPAHDHFVIAFGDTQSQVHLIANVVYTTRTRIDGEDMYIVGCCYKGRAHYDRA